VVVDHPSRHTDDRLARNLIRINFSPVVVDHLSRHTERLAHLVAGVASRLFWTIVHNRILGFPLFAFSRRINVSPTWSRAWPLLIASGQLAGSDFAPLLLRSPPAAFCLSFAASSYIFRARWAHIAACDTARRRRW
jgi:hypothetical protein